MVWHPPGEGKVLEVREYTLARREPGQIVTGVRVPHLSGKTGSAYVKIRNKASHYALAGAAAVVTLDGDGTCSGIAVGVTGAASKAFRLTDAEKSLKLLHADGSRLLET